MNKRWQYFGFFFILSYSVCLSQVATITGRIIDNDTRKAIDGASVYIIDLNGAIVNYVYSDKDGAFKIEVKDRSIDAELNIIFSFIGYEQQKHPLKEFNANATIELNPSEIRLPEVKIISRSIKEQGDTLIYNVARFKLAQDRSIADVLRKMPGMKVSGDGSIYYQGEPINKFYIEGVDLLDEKYKLASNNLKADYVTEVQVLQQHEPIKSLRGKTFSEQAAINLVLSEQAKRKWLLSVDVGIGLPPMLWDNRLMAMSFDKSNQNLSMYKNNNTGDDISSELSSPSNISDILINTKVPRIQQSLFHPDILTYPPVDKKKYLFNSSHLITTNQIWKLRKDRDVRFQLSYLNNREKKQLDSEQSYHLNNDSTLIIAESKDQKHFQNRLDADFTYTHNAETFYLKNKLSSIIAWNRQENFIASFNDTFEEKYNLPQQSFRNDFRIVLPQKKSRLEVTSLSQFSVLSHDAFFTRDDGSGVYPYSQDYKFQNFITNNQLGYTFQLNKYQIKNSAGIDFTAQNMNSLLHPPLNLNLDNSNNNITYKNSASFLESQLSYKSEKVDYYINLLFKYSSIHVNNKDSLKKYDYVNFLPSVGLKFYPSNWWTISLKGQVTDKLADIRTIYPQGLFTNYRTINSYNESPTQNISQRYILSVTYRNPIKGFFLEGSAGYTTMKRPILNKTYFVDSLFQQNQTLPVKNNSYSHLLGINASKMFRWWNTKIFFTSYYRQNKYSYMLQNRENEFLNKSFSIETRITIQPSKWFNNEYVFNYMNNHLKKNDVNTNDFSSSYFQHKLTSYFIPFKNMQIGVIQNFYKMDGEYYFLDIKTSYLFNSIELSFQMSNITNQNKYQYENIGEFYKSYTVHYMRPREFLVKMNLSF